MDFSDNNLPEIIAAFGEWNAPQADVDLPWSNVEEVGGDVNYVQIGDVNFGSSDILDVSWDESTHVEDILDVEVAPEVTAAGAAA